MRDPKRTNNWSTLSANEFRQLANGVGGQIKSLTNTIKFITMEDVPSNHRKDVTYGKFVCNDRPENKEKNFTQFTVGGDCINYPGCHCPNY